MPVRSSTPRRWLTSVDRFSVARCCCGGSTGGPICPPHPLGTAPLTGTLQFSQRENNGFGLTFTESIELPLSWQGGQSAAYSYSDGNTNSAIVLPPCPFFGLHAGLRITSMGIVCSPSGGTYLCADQCCHYECGIVIGELANTNNAAGCTDNAIFGFANPGCSLDPLFIQFSRFTPAVNGFTNARMNYRQGNTFLCCPGVMGADQIGAELTLIITE